jgi:type III restriction enzyme
LEEELEDLDEDLKDVLEEHPLRLEERRVVLNAQRRIERIETELEGMLTALSGMAESELEVADESPQRDLVQEIEASVKATAAEARRTVHEALNDVKDRRRKLNDHVSAWERNQAKYEASYSKAQAASKEHEAKLKEIQGLREREAKLNGVLAEAQEKATMLANAERNFQRGIEDWIQLNRERSDILSEACRRAEAESDGDVRVILHRGAVIDRALEKLQGSLTGCRIHDGRWESLGEYLTDDNIIARWKEFLEELRRFAEISEDQLPGDGEPMSLSSWELPESVRGRMMSVLTPEDWLSVALTPLQDDPQFLYVIDDDREIPFEDASAGQQATALLRILLKQGEGPLIIDQPEEDLDNEIIGSISEALWEAKRRRQVIFASHNANIVVNGDAELVAHCRYRQEDDRTMGCVDPIGAIDMPEVRTAITRVMEGGEEAFTLRKEKYGF